MHERLRFVPIATGLYALLGGVITLSAWAFDVPRLADWNGDGVSMQPNAALASTLAGLAILLVVAGRRRAATLVGLAVLLLGAATIVEHTTGLDLVIDRVLLFGRTWGSDRTVAPGRMGMPASVSWTLFGSAVLLLHRRGRTQVAVPAVGIAIMFVAALSIIGYTFGADPLYGLPRLTAIALQTATILFFVGIGLVAIAVDRQPMRLLVEDSAAGELARRALPFTLLLPVLLGALSIYGYEHEVYEAKMGLAVLVLLLTTTLCAVLWSGVVAVRAREDQLRRSETRFSRFMQYFPGLAWIKDAEGRYVYINETAENIFGVANHELQGQTDDDLFDAATAMQFKENDRQAFREGKGVQVVETLKHDDGMVHHSLVSKFPIAVDADESAIMGGMAIDITDLKRAQDTVTSLLRINRRLSSTLDLEELLDVLIQEAIHLVHAESGVSGLRTAEGLRCTKYFQKGTAVPLDYTWPAGQGLPGWLIVHKSSYLTNYATGAPQIIGELRERVGVRSALATPILDSRGEVVGFFEVHNKWDGKGFTPEDQEMLASVAQSAAIAVQNALAYRSLQEAEERLKRSDQRKDEFLATLAHELRNPLAPIRTGLEIMQHSKAGQAAFDEAQHIMDRQISHMVRLVDDLLDLSRISRDKLELRMQPVDVAGVIRQAVEIAEPLAHQKNQSIEVSLLGEPVELHGDPIRLTQVFSNLLNNACKFSPADGSISIAAEREGSDVVITIKDAGIGIPAENLDQVFEMFTQVHHDGPKEGLGIGLTLVKRLVELHGGSIGAHSDGRGRGSKFIVRLPVALAQPEPEPVPVPADEPASQQLPRQKLLIIDDNRDAAMTLNTLMKLMGHETATAHGGREGIETAEAFQPDIILLDIGMPGMSGYDVCRAIRGQPWGAGMLIVAVSGWGTAADREKSAAAGFDEHLVKPVAPETLISLLAELVERRELEAKS